MATIKTESDSFFAAVYACVRAIPRGKVASYGAVAAMAGKPRAARAVGWALHVNPDPDGIPCYRVVNRAGRLSSAFAFGGINVQRALLERDGVGFDANGNVRREYFWWGD
ncbi:MAG: MGMT family protein [Clostridia bacterium]|jgi:methylated-DNA-protein-cysteine methyltransferase-like protein|nr:MGMT family protein [Clostridia bacterium]